MGNYENLKQSITEVIRTNGNQEITGAVLQSTLLTIISTVGSNATFAGIATPATNPGTPDGPIFWLASESGTYTNFNAIELQAGLSVLMWNGSWSGQQIFSIDDVPTAGSNNLVKSGGVQEELALGAVYDVSAKNPTAGPNNDGKFESLSALLGDTNLNTLIPTSVRKGGMSIKFVQSSDNKYVQYRYMLADVSTVATFTNVANWQGVDDEPTVGSENLVKSGGVAQKIAKLDYDGNIFGWENLPKDDGYILYSTGNPASAAAGMYKHINKIFYVTAGTYIEYKIYGMGGGDIALIAVYDNNYSYQQGQSVCPALSNGFVEGALTIQQDGYIKISFNESTLDGGIPEGSYVYFDADYIRQDNILKSELTERIDSDRDNITLSESDLYDVYANVSKTNARISDASTGTITPDASWRLTDYVSLKNKPVSEILFLCDNESNVHIAYYDKNKQYIGCYPIPSTVGDAQGCVIPIFDIPNNAYYFRYNYATWEKKGCVMYYKNPASISKDIILDMSKCFDTDTVIQNGFLQSNGVNTNMTTYRTTLWIKIPHNYTIVINGYDALGYPLAIYSYRFVDVCAWGEPSALYGASIISLTASESDMYFICQFGGQYKDTIDVKYGVPEIRIYNANPYTEVHNRNLGRKVEYNKFIYKEGIKALINNVLCIGDSITEGVLATGTTGDRLPYPTVLAEITSWNVTNAGVASRTAVSWVSEKLNAYNYANYDTFIIYFGTNDTILNTLSGDFDGDTDYSSPDDYAATTEGQYARLVETILTQNPSAKIFLLRGGFSCGYMNTCIEKLKEKYNSTILDINDADDTVWLRNPIYHSPSDYGHYNQLGYCVFASKVFDLLAKSLVN